MKLLVAALAAVLAATQASATPCTATLDGCYLRDLKTNKETKLTAGSNTYDYIDGYSRHSIRCDIDGHVDQVTYGFTGETDHRTWGRPFWIDGSSADGYVDPADWLQFCGTKTFTVSVKTWAHACFDTSFEITSRCGGTKPAPSPVSKPVSKPVPKPVPAPVAAPTDAPVVAPTEAPVPAPTDPPAFCGDGNVDPGEEVSTLIPVSTQQR